MQRMRKQNWLVRILTVLVACSGNPTWSMSYCSNTIRFDFLCPDPRFGSREAGTSGGGGGIVPGGGFGGSSSNTSPDTYIALHNNPSNNYPRGRSGTSSYGYGPGNGYTGRSYVSGLSIKDPTTRSCDFHRNEMETAEVTEVHVTEHPWTFRHANQCTHIVKFNYDIQNGGSAGSGGVESGGGTSSGNLQSLCQREVGFRRQSSQDRDHFARSNTENQGHDEEIATKTNVYFWHNLTLYSHSAEFVDTITNYHWSREDLSCVQDKRNAQYVQIAVTVSKSGRCEIIVQQYKIDDKRSPWGCAGASAISYPIRFCGSYECSQSNGILTGLKLLPRRDLNPIDTNVHQPHWNSGGNSRIGFSPSRSHNVRKGSSSYDSGEGTDYQIGNSGGGDTPCTEMPETTSTTTTTTTAPSNQQHGTGDTSEEEEKMDEPFNWVEASFLFIFPAGGIVVSLVILFYLRSRDENCRDAAPRFQSHSYDESRPDVFQPQHGHYRGSFNSIDKHELAM